MGWSQRCLKSSVVLQPYKKHFRSCRNSAREMGTTAAQQLGGTSGTSAYAIEIPLDSVAFLVRH